MNACAPILLGAIAAHPLLLGGIVFVACFILGMAIGRWEIARSSVKRRLNHDWGAA